jgi:hypothetical protein
MSSGELNSDNPVREIQFDGPTLLAEVAAEMAAIEDARGNVRGAAERLREQVNASQREVDKTREALTQRELDMMSRVEGLELVGRTIEFEEGKSLGEVRFARGLKPAEYVLPVSKDLEGVSGVITGTKIGTSDRERAADLLLEVDVRGRLIPPRAFRRYVISASDVRFSIGEAPEHADH